MFGFLAEEMRKNAENFTTTASKAYRPPGRFAESKMSSRPPGERRCGAIAIPGETSFKETLNEWNLRNTEVKPRDQSETPLRFTTELVCFYAR